MKQSERDESYIIIKKIKGWWMNKTYDVSFLDNNTIWERNDGRVVIETAYVSGKLTLWLRVEGEDYIKFNNMYDFYKFCEEHSIDHPITMQRIR